ncbi:MAG: Rpn family recombination-promoting nuclease/putative transposase [Planctomycetaceae bacterium]|nr:Rpn family recombination-promoting nuclease/putative transposase [Planctomycetaceae bacterium]
MGKRKITQKITVRKKISPTRREQPVEMPESSEEHLPLTHDRFFGETFKVKRLAKGFLRQTLPGELLDHLDLDGLTTEPRHLTDELFKEFITDVVYRVPIKGTDQYADFFVFLEHKSYNDGWTIFQLWIYVVFVCLQEYRKAEHEGRLNANYRLPPIFAIIIHHGETQFTASTELSELFRSLPGIEAYLPKFRAVLFDLNAIPDDEVADDPDAPELKLVLMALKTVFRKDVSVKIKAILEELGPSSDDPLLRRFIRIVWLYLVSRAKHMERDYGMLFNTIKTIVEVESMPTMLEKWTAEATAKAEARGKAGTLLKILRKRFNKVPKDVENTIHNMNDPVALDSWAEHALDCQSMAEFAQAVR